MVIHDSGFDTLSNKLWDARNKGVRNDIRYTGAYGAFY